MTHCEKCIHYELCKRHENLIPDNIVTFFPHNESCPMFKNKSDFVEVKHGEWMPIDIEQISFGCIDEATIYKCSLCGRYEDKQEPYCNCGAKMDGK